jgi:hypothetical protein
MSNLKDSYLPDAFLGIMLHEVRNFLLEEAMKSPALLSDLAGLEQYVAESYDARSFVELLQNADDAGASRFAIQRAGDLLVVANDGREFNQQDFESLCRSAASSKHRGTSIGFRGIGFKSVVGFAKAIHLFSGQLEATFSRELTARAIPEATRVPLVRIPHPVEPGLRNGLCSTLDRLRGDGFKTVFVFADLIASGIEAEFAAFDPTSLLFLRHIRQVELNAGVEAIITVRREVVDSRTRSIRLASSEGATKWSVIERDGIALAFVCDEAGTARLEEAQAVVHAFLPTLETTGFPFKINGDLSTDPSRTRIILDERTAAGIASIAKLIVALIDECLNALSAKADAKLLAALMPISDPRMAGFHRRGFKTELYSAVKREASERFAGFLCRPQWLNAMDFSKLAEASGVKAVPRSLEGVEGLTAFLKFLGAKEATINDVSPGLVCVAPSIGGAAEVATHVSNLLATKQIESEAIDVEWRLWPVGDVPLSLDEARKQNEPLVESFTDLIAEKPGGGIELPRMLESLTDSTTAARLLPSKPAVSSQSPSAGVPATTPTQRISLKRWRAAEQQVLEILKAWGWRVEDVSRQNLGYDIEGRTDTGEDVSVEVKSLDFAGQAFTMTSNEEAVARQKGKAYRLALVRQTGDQLEVAFIQDPINQLKLTRQCRQWVWECAAYEFRPQRFSLE